MKTLIKQRKKIDKINQRILKLLSKRMKSSEKIGNYKRINSSKIKDKKREKQMLEKISRQAKKYNLSKPFAHTIFQEILKESKRLQNKKVNQ